MFLVDSNPTVERIARLIFDYASEQGLPVVRVTVWETPTSFAEYRRRKASPQASTSSSSISTARSSIRAATSPTPPTRCSVESGGAPLAGGRDRPHGRRRRGDARRARVRGGRTPASSRMRSPVFSRIYDARLLKHTRPYPDDCRGAGRARASACARGADQQAARRHAPDSRRARSRAVFSAPTRSSAATVRSRASPIPPDCST